MKPISSVPQIVLEAGLPARFRYWSGGSGRRYLFTRTDVETAGHFDNAVVIIARYGRIVWAGLYAEPQNGLSPMHQLTRRAGAQIFVHLLARDEVRRSEIVEDLKLTIAVDQVDTDHSARILEFPTAA